MNKGVLILILGLVAAVAAYGCIYFVCTSSARTLQQGDAPELAWLKEEFNLTDAELSACPSFTPLTFHSAEICAGRSTRTT